jgi:hypothetical protein
LNLELEIVTLRVEFDSRVDENPNILSVSVVDAIVEIDDGVDTMRMHLSEEWAEEEQSIKYPETDAEKSSVVYSNMD